MADAEPEDFNSAVRDAFLKFFVHLLRDYRSYMGGWDGGPDALNSLIDRSGFVSNHAESDTSKQFLETLIDTQMAQMFFEDRVFAADRSFEVMYFDAHIDRLQNTESKNHGAATSSSAPNESTSSFLDDSSQNIRENWPVAPPTAEEFNGAGPFKCGNGTFPNLLEWEGLPEPRKLPRLAQLHRGSHFLRRTSKVTHVLESVYLNFYTRKRNFKSRFKIVKKQAESGLSEVQALLSLLDSEAMTWRRFEKAIAKLASPKAWPTLGTDVHEEAREKLWPGLLRGMASWSVGVKK